MQSGLLSVTTYQRVLSFCPLDQSSVESEVTPSPRMMQSSDATVEVVRGSYPQYCASCTRGVTCYVG